MINTTLETVEPTHFSSIGQVYAILRHLTRGKGPDVDEGSGNPSSAPEGTPEGRDDLSRAVQEMMGSYGKVVAPVGRSLQSDELEALVKERRSIDSVLKFVDARKEAIREMVLCEMDEAFPVDDPTVERDAKGHWLRSAKIAVPEAKASFSWEVSSPKVDVSVDALASLIDDEEVPEFNAEDYMAVVVTEVKVDPKLLFDLLKRKPNLMRHIGKAVSSSAPGRAAFFVRKL